MYFDSDRRYLGIVCTVNLERNFGFIRSPHLDGDYHFYLKDLPSVPQIGTEIEFKPLQDIQRGMRWATRITIIPDRYRSLDAEKLLQKDIKLPAPVPSPVNITIPEPMDEEIDQKPTFQAEKGLAEGKEVGIISGVKDSFGFIRNPKYHDDIFFHFRDVLAQDQSELVVGAEVEYEPARDPRNGKTKAIKLKLLPKGTVDQTSTRTESKTGKRKRYEVGMIIKAERTFGNICCTERDEEVFFHISDLQRKNPHVKKDEILMGMEVEFVVVANPETNKTKAVDIKVLPPGSVKFDVNLKLLRCKLNLFRSRFRANAEES
eukprot:TRINITY_DN6402_c0_g1_i1.p1 TRINITY_DN6402_c0_g1~~TRINITY_DN6402_c0_g1_i1.p1  ORF type:complete len:318 (+),score=63.65 TRINITY_DN6402_c0_g1_i1:47-1000(+)